MVPPAASPSGRGFLAAGRLSVLRWKWAGGILLNDILLGTNVLDCYTAGGILWRIEIVTRRFPAPLTVNPV